MDLRLVYAKTPTGDEAVRQSTRVVQRNLRMVLVQVDGKLNVEELSAKIGNSSLVENALRELEESGLIAPTHEAVSIWEESKRQHEASLTQDLAVSQFSSFGASVPAPPAPPGMARSESPRVNFSSFDKPILQASAAGGLVFPELPETLGAASSGELRTGMGTVVLRRWLPRVLLGVFLICGLLVLFFPYQRLKPELEIAASRIFRVPVQVGDVGLVLLPRPQLRLSAVRIGDKDESTIAEMKVDSLLSLLMVGQPVISSVDLVGASLSAEHLAAMPLFSGEPADGFLIRKIRVHELSVTVRQLPLGKLSGEVLFNDDGRIQKAVLSSLDQSLRLDASASARGILLDIDGYGWKPLEGSVDFTAFQAKGVLQKGQLLIDTLETTTLGGLINGNWLLDWSGNGLVLSGNASLSRLDCQKLASTFIPSLKLEGELTGNLKFRSAGDNWEQLWRNVQAGLVADIGRGVFHGVDLGEAVRRGAGNLVQGGSTKFDRLRVNLTINQRQVAGRDLQMNAGMVTASGQFVAVRNQPVNGNLLVTMQTSVSTTRAAVQVAGALPGLVAVSQ